MKPANLRIYRIFHDVSIGVIDIYPSGFVILLLSFFRNHSKEDGLGLGVVIHGLVEIQVVFGEIGEHCIIKFAARHAAHHQSVRGNLHAHMGHFLLGHLVEESLQIDDIGGGIVSRELLIANQRMNGADDAGLVTFFFQNVADHMGGGGFPIGAGQSDHPHLFCRIVKEERHHVFHGLSCVLYIYDRNAFRCFYRLRCHDGFRAFFGCRLYEPVAVHMSAHEANE